MNAPLLLAIDTSCDETSVAVTRGQEILSTVISSQVRYHKAYGGVVPFMAQRLHKERIDLVVTLALSRAGVTSVDLEGIAITYGPGLAPCLEVGLDKARVLSAELKLPLYGVNHMSGHIASCVAGRKETLQYPALALLVSGGHTEMVLLESFSKTTIVGATLDDALGEAYDKVAKMLGLGYPGGKLISNLAKHGNDQAYPLPIPMLRNPGADISYSGLKTAVKYLLDDIRKEHEVALPQEVICDLAASFERVAQEGLMRKVRFILGRHPEIRQILLAGGVAANTALRKRVRAVAKTTGATVHTPKNLALCTDNAAMIGVAAWLGIQDGGLAPTDGASLDRAPQLSFTRA